MEKGLQRLPASIVNELRQFSGISPGLTGDRCQVKRVRVGTERNWTGCHVVSIGLCLSALNDWHRSATKQFTPVADATGDLNIVEMFKQGDGVFTAGIEQVADVGSAGLVVPAKIGSDATN